MAQTVEDLRKLLQPYNIVDITEQIREKWSEGYLYINSNQYILVKDIITLQGKNFIVKEKFEDYVTDYNGDKYKLNIPKGIYTITWDPTANVDDVLMFE